MKEQYKKTELGWIPEEWSVNSLSDIAEINPKKEVLDNEKQVSFIPMEYVSNLGRVINMDIRNYGDVSKGYTAFKDKDVLLAKITPCFENGKKAVVRNLKNGYGFGSTEFHVLRSKDQRSIPEFLYYYVSTNKFRQQAELNMTGSAGQKRVPTTFLNDNKLVVPPLKEQQKIAEILSTVDSEIDDTDKLIEKTKELKKGLMQRLLTKGIGHTEFKKTEIGEIPVEWEVKKSEEVFNLITDYVANGSFADLRENVSYRDEEDYAVLIRLTDYKNNYKGPFVYVDKNAYDFLDKSKLEANDIIIANVGAYAGYVFRAPNWNKPMTLGPNSILVRTKEDREFMYYWMSSDIGQKIIKTIISTTAQPKFNKTDFKKIMIPIPLIKEQQKITNILLSVDTQIEEYKNKKAKLEELKKGLMQQLLTGKIRVMG
ncbi:restriction endonuclease subunit S [Clostridium tetani]|uniref:restriction endonuclease subunit S n=1 Tax=Clostridium tetani TaxID=1513 RepID=UPI002954E9D1|nr:restriction endonuclease subunit S [Clostridium tetani]